MRARTTKEIESIVRDYQSGMSLKEITSKYKCEKRHIYKYLEKMGVKSDRNTNHYREKVLELLETGKTVKEILETINCRPNSLKTIAAANGYKLKYTTPESEKEMVEDFKSGKSLEDISVKNYCAKMTVYSVLKNAGCEVKNPSNRTINQSSTKKSSRKLDRALLTTRLIPLGDRPLCEPINCEFRTKCNCYYGNGTSKDFAYCDYLTIEGKLRGCSGRKCDKYISIADAEKLIKEGVV